MNAVFDIFISPFRLETPWPAMLAVSILTSLIVLMIFKYTSNQKALKARKGRLIGRLLELHIFRHDIVENIKAFGRVLIANASYLGVFLKPLLISLLPLMFIFFQAAEWFNYRPLHPGEETLLTATLSADYPVLKTETEFNCSKNIEVTAPPVRIEDGNQSVWRIEIKNETPAWIEMSFNNKSIKYEIITGTSLKRISMKQNKTGDSAVSFSIAYPERKFTVLNKNQHWILIYLVLTLFTALPLKKLLQVEL